MIFKTTLSALIFLFLTPVCSQELFMGNPDGLPNQVERIYVKGLDYLTRAQAADGSWASERYGQEPGVVGLAVVALLAHGDDPNHGPYALPVQRGLDFILKNQEKSTGYIGPSMYNHGFATLALAEAYGAVEDPRLGPALQSAVELIVSSQKSNPQNAWRYSPQARDADTTVSGAQIVALFAARNAGIGVPEDAIQKGLEYLRQCQSEQGGIGYTSDSGPNAPRTAIGVLCFALAKEKNTDAFRKAFTFLEGQELPRTYYNYFLYYGAQAFFHASPQAWNQWNRENITRLNSSQNPDGSWDGSFGATFSTAASLLSLALNYRYLPIYER